MSEEQQVLLDHDAALAEYQHRKMVESMMGPIISLVVHALMMGSLILFYDAEAKAPMSSVELEMKELEVKELDPKTMEELEKLEDIAQEMVPTVEKPTISTDEMVDVSSVADFSDAMASTDDNMDFSDVLNVRANDSPLKLSSLYGGRSNEGRQKTLKKFGGSDVTESAVLRALRWLKKTQNADGSWAPGEKEAMTGLGLLTFLAHGETPMSEEFGPTVQKAMQYLAGQVDKWPAKVTDKKWHSTFSYSTGIVAYALSEGYGLTKIPFLKPAMEKSLAYIVDGQLRNGGYSYGYNPDGKWDMSVAGWQYQAMKAGYVAGADVPGLEKAIEKGLSFMEKVSFSKVNNRFGYNVPGNGTDGLQGAGTLCLQLLGSGDSFAAKAG
ncbi:MAG: terpene cyclase/mutase family protein, partial [Lentisphaerae bacterium]|nr:terpene cyclase/mutase family protein [Lentisphaerota bacterium]